MKFINSLKLLAFLTVSGFSSVQAAETLTDKDYSDLVRTLNVQEDLSNTNLKINTKQWKEFDWNRHHNIGLLYERYEVKFLKNSLTKIALGIGIGLGYAFCFNQFYRSSPMVVKALTVMGMSAIGGYIGFLNARSEKKLAYGLQKETNEELKRAAIEANLFQIKTK